jgi:hypothetical protein
MSEGQRVVTLIVLVALVGTLLTWAVVGTGDQRCTLVKLGRGKLTAAEAERLREEAPPGTFGACRWFGYTPADSK